MLVIDDKIRAKLLIKHSVNETEILEAFANRKLGLLEDKRAENITVPPTQWFIAETHKGRLLKIVFILDNGNIHIKTAYEPNSEEIRIYNKYA